MVSLQMVIKKLSRIIFNKLNCFGWLAFELQLNKALSILILESLGGKSEQRVPLLGVPFMDLFQIHNALLRILDQWATSVRNPQLSLSTSQA